MPQPGSFIPRLNMDAVIRNHLELQMEGSDNMPLLNCPLVQEYLNSERIKDPDPFKREASSKCVKNALSNIGGYRYVSYCAVSSALETAKLNVHALLFHT